MIDTYDIILPNIASSGLYYFMTDNEVEYEVRFGRKKNNLYCANIVFGVLNEEYEGEEYVLTNKVSDVFKVMNTVVEVIKIYVQENEYLTEFEFSGEPIGEENQELTKRTRVFFRYASMISHALNWKLKRDKNLVKIYKA